MRVHRLIAFAEKRLQRLLLHGFDETSKYKTFKRKILLKN